MYAAAAQGPAASSKFSNAVLRGLIAATILSDAAGTETFPLLPYVKIPYYSVLEQDRGAVPMYMLDVHHCVCIPKFRPWHAV